MVIYIIGAILLFILLLLWKNSYENRTPIYEKVEYTNPFGRIYTKDKKIGYEYYDRIEMPLWLLLLLIIVFLIPIANITALIFLIIRLLIDNDTYIHFNERSLWSKIGVFFEKIGKFLNKDVF